MTPRTLRNWKRDDPAQPTAAPGRPPLEPAALDEARDLVQQQLEEQGWGAGEEPVWRGLDRSIPRARVRRVLRDLKAERRARRRAHAHEQRVSTTVLARDALWSMDATHLGRDPAGDEVQAEVVRDVASTRTIGNSVGPAATGEDVVRLLEHVAHERGGYPLVLLTDNGGAYRSAAVDAWCAAHRVLHLFSLPHTPEHNAGSEHGMRDLKEDSALGKGTLVHDNQKAQARLAASRDRIDNHRLRRTRGWRTAAVADAQNPHWSEIVTRTEVYEAGTCAIQEAMLRCHSARAERRAVREAILGTLQRFSVITRTRGGRPWCAQCEEDDL